MRGRATSNSKTQRPAGKENGLGTKLGSGPHKTAGHLDVSTCELTLLRVVISTMPTNESLVEHFTLRSMAVRT